MTSSSETGTHPAPPGGSAPLTSPDLDLRALAAALAGSIQGEVRFSDGDRHLYATDASNFRQVPLGVVLPRTVEDIVKTVRVCREFGAPITNRGGGTSLAGQATNAAVILDTSKYVNAIVDVDPDAATATVRPGLVLDTLRERIARHGLTWGPDPATHNRCTVGGMLGNNACGMHAFAFGRVQDNVEALQILLYDGTVMTVGRHDADDVRRIVTDGGRRGHVYRRLRDLAHRYAEPIRERYPAIPRRISGYNLTELLPERGFHLARALVGTEGTCVTILQATLQLNPLPSGSALVVLGYRDVCEAGDHVSELRRADGLYALEGMDGDLLDNIRDEGTGVAALEELSTAGAYLLCEFRGASDVEARDAAEDLLGHIGDVGGPAARLYTAEPEVAEIWGAREAALGVTARFRGELRWPGWEDAAVDPDEVGDYLRDLRSLVGDYGYDASVYGHFGDGCVHCRINFDLMTPDGRATYRSFCEEAADLVSSYGGSYSGEHGDGQQRGELLERMYGAELVGAMREFKAIFDPANRMNPGKVVDAHGLDENLRLDAVDDQWRPATRLAYPDDGFDFNHAQLRCVGVGKCRRDDGAGTMCPSYMVTHEEMHSTRGRARLLFEMLQPDSRLDGWRDETVRQALDLCLSCKGCAVDCPVNVDIATYKAEFLHHHYEGRRRPRIHYAMGLIDVWSRVASRTPGLANLALDAPFLGTALKAAAGVAVRRSAPHYAAETFREWFEARGGAGGRRGERRVILFPDTFVNHFEPEIGRATVSVLEDAGYSVTLPPPRLCCGRPLYDHGMLDVAGTYLDRLVAALAEDVTAGVKIVGMEPSCVAVLRDELLQMRPHDAGARRVAEATMTLAEFLVDEAGYSFPTLQREAIVHGHCHHKAVVGMAADGRALDALRLDWTELDAGCCGLAGAFGFEAGDKYEVSVAAGERRLLPAVRDAPPDTIVIADGFSCRTQIRQLQRINGAGGRRRRALHLAQVIEMARREGPVGPPAHRTTVEDGYAAAAGVRGLTRKDVRTLGLIAAAGLATATLAQLLRRAR